MRKDIREAAWLGFPPSIFTTNGSESINAAIKRKVNYKESEWPQFNDHMKQLITCQHEEIVRSLSGRGQYRLKPEFSHYGVSNLEWMKMRPDNRKEIIDSFQKAPLPRSSECLRTSISELSVSNEATTSLLISQV